MWWNGLVWLSALIYITQPPFACIQKSGVFFKFFCTVAVRLFIYGLHRKLRTQAQVKPLAYTDTQQRLSLVTHYTECPWQAAWWNVTAGKELIIDYDSSRKASLEVYFKNAFIILPPETVLIYKDDPTVGHFNLEIIWREQITFTRFQILSRWAGCCFFFFSAHTTKSSPVGCNIIYWNNGHTSRTQSLPLTQIRMYGLAACTFMSKSDTVHIQALITNIGMANAGATHNMKANGSHDRHFDDWYSHKVDK